MAGLNVRLDGLMLPQEEAAELERQAEELDKPLRTHARELLLSELERRK